MTIAGVSQDLLKCGTSLVKATHKEDPTPPQGFFLFDDDSIQKLPETSSGFQARVYVNPERQHMWIAIAGTNEWVDMLAWPAIEMGYNPSSSFFSVQHIDDAVHFAETVRNAVEGSELYKAYKMHVAGYSFGGTLSEVLGETFGWAGVSLDGSGGKEIVTSPQYAKMLSERGLTIKGSPGHIAASTDTTLVGRFGDHIANTIHYVISLDEQQQAATHEDNIPGTRWYDYGLETVYSIYSEITRVVQGWNTHDIDFLAQKIEEDHDGQGPEKPLMADVDDVVAPSQPALSVVASPPEVLAPSQPFASVAVSPPEGVADAAFVSDAGQSSTFWEWVGIV